MSVQADFLSNSHYCDLLWMGITYPTLEHAYQACKVMDTETRLIISRAETPAQAKRLGRLVELRPDWKKVKDEILYLLVLKKFGDLRYRQRLFETGDSELVEEEAEENSLGGILMKVRHKLRKGIVG